VSAARAAALALLLACAPARFFEVASGTCQTLAS
jgi:hypothetical protein